MFLVILRINSTEFIKRSFKNAALKWPVFYTKAHFEKEIKR